MIARENPGRKWNRPYPHPMYCWTCRNITIIRAGSNTNAFQHLIDFWGIAALILTDIDTIHPNKSIWDITTYSSCPVSALAHVAQRKASAIKDILGQNRSSKSDKSQKFVRICYPCSESVVPSFSLHVLTHWIALMIGSYPVQRQRFPERAMRISSSSGLGFFSSSAYADINIPGVQKPHCTAPQWVKA